MACYHPPTLAIRSLSMSDESERRRHQRYPTDDLPGSLVFSLDADVRNISLAGMAVTTYSPFSLDQKYDVELGQEQDSVHVVAVVRWCHLTGTETNDDGDSVSVYEAGFEFEKVLSDRAQTLMKFLERHAVIDLEDRLFGRLEPRNDESVSLSSQYEFEVKTLSYSGMAIEIGFSVAVGAVFPMTISLGERSFQTPGRIANVVKADIEDKKVRYLMGVEFVEPDPAEREKLSNFIREHLAAGDPPSPTADS